MFAQQQSKMTTTEKRGVVERTLLALDIPPWDALYRGIVGFTVMPLYFAVGGAENKHGMLLLFALAILAATRLIPALLRRILPFSAAIRAVWAHRRAMAKRYDSYQWRKLWAFGLGWLANLVFLGGFRSAAMVLASSCFVAGIGGAAFWRVRSNELAREANSTDLYLKTPKL